MQAFYNGVELEVDCDDHGQHFVTLPLEYKPTEPETFEAIAMEPTPEELAAQERAEIIDRCAKAGTTKGLSEEERAKVANEPAFLRVCQAERAAAKEAMEARVSKEAKENQA